MKCSGHCWKGNQPCPHPYDCSILEWNNGGKYVDTDLPTPTAPIERIADGVQRLGYAVFVALLVFAAALMGIALPYFFNQ
jgi:hypothetical protein